MADDIILDTISGSPVAATDDVGGKHYQWVKLAFGANDVVTKVEPGTGLPVSLQSGTNSVGKVEVTDLLPGTGATNLGKAADSPVGATDVGVSVLAKRVDTPATITPANGDYAPLQLTSTGALRVSVDSGAAQAQIDDAAFTPGTSEVVVVGYFADETATDSVDEGEQGAARMTLDRKQIVATYAHSAGGWTPHSRLSVGTTEDETVVKASAGTLGWLVVTNTNASARYIKFYNSTNPVVGTDAPVLRFLIPPSSNGFTINFGPGVEFTTGISYALVTGVADSDVIEVAANEIIVNLGYK